MASSSNTITMDCKKCGGQLKISPNAYILQCMYCGTQYLVRREFGNVFLDSYAACPLCHRNDKVKKLSALAQMNSTMYNFYPPPKPQYPVSEPGGCLNIIRSFFAVCAGIWVFVIMIRERLYEHELVILAAIIVISMIIAAFSNRQKQQFQTKKNHYLYQKELQWKQEYEEWDKLYYCERDDIVFIIGTTKHLPAEEYSRRRMELNQQ